MTFFLSIITDYEEKYEDVMEVLWRKMKIFFVKQSMIKR